MEGGRVKDRGGDEVAFYEAIAWALPVRQSDDKRAKAWRLTTTSYRNRPRARVISHANCRPASELSTVRMNSYPATGFGSWILRSGRLGSI